MGRSGNIIVKCAVGRHLNILRPMQQNDWKAAARAAHGDLDAMMTLCKAIILCEVAMPNQIEAAKALWRSLFAANRKVSETRFEVVKSRFHKLTDQL